MLVGITARSAFKFKRNAEDTLLKEGDLETEQAAELDDLNRCLDVLAEVFPDVQPQVFRELLQSFSKESRLELVTEALLTKKNAHVKGRWLAPGRQTLTEQGQGSALSHVLQSHDRFRSSCYRKAVKSALYEEFNGLSHSSIKAVLAENNHSYTLTRPILLDLVTRSWRYTLTNLLGRRKPPSLQEHRLLKWNDLQNGQREPFICATSSIELNTELEETILNPLLLQLSRQQLDEDVQLADKINDVEADLAQAMYDCECCFMSSSFEKVGTCFESCHFVCFDCLQRSLKEALYGQGWSQSVDLEHGSLRCIALNSSTTGSCSSYISKELVQRAANPEMWQKFEERLASDDVLASHLEVIKCPICCYAEVDCEGNRKPSLNVSVLLKTGKRIFWMMLAVIVLCLVIPTFLCSAEVIVEVSILLSLFSVLIRLFTRLGGDYSRSGAWQTSTDPNAGRKFHCRNPDCLRVSCLNCKATWYDPHICYSSARQSLRLFVENAITRATTRTCPTCRLNFVKDSGCNKMTCPQCGYAMCWVCRAHVPPKTGYAHFCPHFRPDGGDCTECERCDLYKVEDENKMIQRVKKAAETEWYEREGLQQGMSIKTDAWTKEDLRTDDFGLRTRVRQWV